MHVYKQSNRSSNAVGRGQRGARRVLPLAPRAASKETSADKTSSLSSVDIDPDALLRASPNSASRLFGFGMSPQWFEAAPRVRVRNADTKQLEELVELAVLNERLSGRLEPWQARRKLEYLRTKRKNWERIFEYITSQDVEATLAAIEEANLKVEATLNAELTRERTGVGALKAELTALQADVIAAQARLADTQTRVEQELERVNALRQEAIALERVRTSVSAPEPVAILAPPALAPTITTTPTIPASPQQTSSLTASPAMEAAAARSTAKRSGSGQKGSKAGMGRDRGLKSSLELEEPLRQHWYAAEFSSRLGKDVMVPFDIFDEPWVLFRDAEGKAGCVKDECAHRACPLSIGKVENGEIVCPYHGWAYDNKGSCTKMPSTPFCKGIQVKALPCVEKDGFVWIWPGRGDPPMDQLPNTLPPEGFDIHAEIFVDVPVEHGLLIENLLDLAHAPFTHTSTFARGWPVPDAVKFHATKLLSGNWDPYPINMAFMPPCITVSMIGLSQPGQIRRGVTAEQCDKHLHQLHVCMPSKKGHTRLLYRMSLDFIPWLRNVPFIDRVWKRVAAQVLGEDLVLVLGQQDRLMRGGDTWRHPVSYDKLAVRYRRWRNELARGNPTGAAAQLSEAKMSAGEMFACEEVAAVEGAGEGRDMCDYAMYDSALEEADRMDSMQMVNESRN